jgi:hypothetical protein
MILIEQQERVNAVLVAQSLSVKPCAARVQHPRNPVVVLPRQKGTPEATRNREIGNAEPVDAQRIAPGITTNHLAHSLAPSHATPLALL